MADFGRDILASRWANNLLHSQYRRPAVGSCAVESNDYRDRFPLRLVRFRLDEDAAARVWGIAMGDGSVS